MKIIIFIFLFVNLFADDEYSLRVAYGKVTASDLGEVLLADWQEHQNDLRVFALDAGYLLSKADNDLPIDTYARIGVAYFDEDSVQDDIYELTLYVKWYYNFELLDNKFRFGFGEGFSLTSDVLTSEYQEAILKNDHYSKFLNYLDISMDVDIGYLTGYKPLYNTYIAWTIKHRSGVFSLFNNVSHGGSNYNTFSIEKNF